MSLKSAHTDRVTSRAVRFRTIRRLGGAVVLIALGFASAGCGAGVRTPAPTESHTDKAAAWPADPYVAADATPTPWPASTEPLILKPGQTVVSITFDDGRASQATAARMLTAHGLSGTFFVNSGRIGMPDFLSLPDLKSMATAGHEIGGHTLNHDDLADLTLDEAQREVCVDRTTLLGWGLPVRSFAYPYGSSTPEIENAVRECGYNSARRNGGLRPHRLADRQRPDLSCELCDATETVPPADPMATRAPHEVENNWTIDDLRGQVTDAIAVGGWLQLTFHKLCKADCDTEANLLPDNDSIATPEAMFEDFVTWLADQQANGAVLVRTVGDVIGGPVQPPVAGPAAPPAPPGTNALANPALEEQTDGIPRCWMHGGFGTNSPEFSLVPDAHGGMTASRLVMRNYVDGDAKLMPTTDLGTCAPTVSPGQAYTIQAWYTSTAPTSFSVYYRLARGIWVYAMSSPQFPPAQEFTPARWTIWAVPSGVTAISFGLTLAQDGELVTDDYSLTAGPP